MSEVSAPPPEFPKIPYEQIVAYDPSLEGVRPVAKVVAFAAVKKAERKVELVRDNGETVDTSGVNEAEQLEFHLRNSLSESRLANIAGVLYEHLNWATTAKRVGSTNLHFYGEALPVDQLAARIKIEPPSDILDSKTLAYVISLERERGEEKRQEPVLYFFPKTVEKLEGKTFYNNLSFHFTDNHPAFRQFIARFALSGFLSRRSGVSSEDQDGS